MAEEKTVKQIKREMLLEAIEYYENQGRKKHKEDLRKAGKVGKIEKAGGGMTGVGLYPAEMARAGTMSQAKRKRYMKKGGGITYKMSGGQVVSHGYD